MVKSIENLRKKKLTGGRRKPLRGRKKFESDSYAAETIVDQTEKQKRRTTGGNYKLFLKRISEANIIDPSTNTSSKLKIIEVIENAASRDYDRRGVLTKGAIIKTEKGNAKVFSRPGQQGIVNAILII
jgi:small subunit ribosomal protein S8e